MQPATARTDQPHVVVVDDDPGIALVLTRYLTSQGFRVSVASGGRALMATIAASAVDVVLLDLGLPGEDGLDLTRELRKTWDGPVIIVSGRGETIDRIVGLELGADDYVAKPFDLRELVARIRSVLRRAQGPARAPAPTAPSRLRFDGYVLDVDARRLSDAAGQDVPLTTGAFNLLLAFVEQPNRVLTRDQLMERTHGRHADSFDRAIDVQVTRLRRVLERDAAHPDLIRSVRGVGYLFAARVERG